MYEVLCMEMLVDLHSVGEKRDGKREREREAR